ncbi:MAG: nucleotidyl transferase AbiEii/AbiGii toxin family protein [Candidatus Riflebacteria bacterium]|nr:nucleotidyl transferase AbiEii/AbiGii toxin family protein [Candidatus Riflebacteria bacterium]
MITRNPMQLKTIIKKKAAEKHIPEQLVLQNYMLERLLERITLTKFQKNFILKGDFLIGAIVGLDARTTMDLDATVKGLELSHTTIQLVFEEICQVSLYDNVAFEITGIEDIRESDDYPGIRVGLKANYPPISVPLFVDVTTGDKITPKAIDYKLNLMFDERSIQVLAYNLETLLAEKIETVISRNIANTRPRDFYDIYILHRLYENSISSDILKRAIEATATKRGTMSAIRAYRKAMQDVSVSERMNGFWNKYRKDYSYASSINFNDICLLIIDILERLGF